MAILVLVLWAFTAGAGFYLLVTGRPGPPSGRPAPAAAPAMSRPAPPPPPSPAARQLPVRSLPPRAAEPLADPPPGQPRPAASSQLPDRSPQRGARDPWAPASLVAARQAPLVPGARALAEFAHPAAAIVGLGFWLGFTLVHAQVLGWIGFGLAAATACVGLAWFAANTRAARRPASAGSAPSFAPRLVALHGSAAAITIALAALTALLLHG